MFELKDKVVVITGAARGIGAAVVVEVLEEGAKQVRVLDIDEAAGISQQNELNQKYGDNKVKFVKCDVTNDEELYKALEDAKKDNGYIDLLINNAGVIDEGTVAKVRKAIEINLIALVNGTLKAIELMRTDKGGRGGAVINISSVVGLLPTKFPALFTYSITKSAVLQFTTCVGQDQCTNTGVRVMAICYGITDARLFESIKCLRAEFTSGVRDVFTRWPMQTAKSAARGTVEVYQKGDTATIWIVNRNEPARDVTASLRKNEEASSSQVGRILYGLDYFEHF